MSSARFVLLLLTCFWYSFVKSQDTFSIVAVDSVTGEVGSAGATCLDATNNGVSAVIISDVLPGRGAIHTQS
ncbi:MAG: secretion protein, partial [Bacteroidota bacterium]